MPVRYNSKLAFFTMGVEMVSSCYKPEFEVGRNYVLKSILSIFVVGAAAVFGE